MLKIIPKNSFTHVMLTSAMLVGLMSHSAASQSTSATLDALLDSREIPVNIDNFIRAATDAEFGRYVSLAGGVNQFFHFRAPTPVENQPTIRMNRDTLYSMAVVDISEGATLTLPDVGDRYMTAMIVNQDHYINNVFSGGGTYELDMETFDTPYVMVFMRVLVDAADPADVAAVNAIQDGMAVNTGSSKPFITPNYDEETLDALISTTLGLLQFGADSSHAFGPKETVDAVRHFIGTAGGWGGLPETEAMYASIEPGLPVGEYRINVPADVPVQAFWSINLYNAAGYFEENAQGAYNINSVNGVRNDDGSMTVHLGGCEDDRVNCVPIVDGWNYLVRMYRPDAEVIDGSWTFPKAEAVK